MNTRNADCSVHNTPSFARTLLTGSALGILSAFVASLAFFPVFLLFAWATRLSRGSDFYWSFYNLLGFAIPALVLFGITFLPSVFLGGANALLLRQIMVRRRSLGTQVVISLGALSGAIGGVLVLYSLVDRQEVVSDKPLLVLGLLFTSSVGMAHAWLVRRWLVGITGKRQQKEPTANCDYPEK